MSLLYHKKFLNAKPLNLFCLIQIQYYVRKMYLPVVLRRQVSFCHGRQNSARARTLVLPRRNDVLKQKYLQGLVFDMDVKN
ncbi:hypothetical protein HMPREF9554_00452 [Treponema phagedenis F0421]|nr:hypothetical protein HMPREF9554_00452 [Treponema phagedenis F0421]